MNLRFLGSELTPHHKGGGGFSRRVMQWRRIDFPVCKF